MPFATRRVGPLTTLNRRQVLGGLLAAGAAGSLAGCVLVEPGPAVPAVAADPLEKLTVEKQALVDLYDATIGAHSSLAGRLRPLRDAHREHRDALLELLDARRRAALARATPPVPNPPGDAESAPRGKPAGASPTAALTALRAAEKVASAASRTACLAETGGGERITVLGSICAGEASHEVALA
ncbi:twin-arginine translocation signal domain-containing protein [Cryptosporangium arvum]|uniref:twin-arginine translocation signal domain-containing protein n=1 Tax=Cryptosporangium arvum TaxID=80871 RepID=UPI0004B78334|nr:twin-arginine translocation signal domain-containing protein [Cryptosporangium arvum]